MKPLMQGKLLLISSIIIIGTWLLMDEFAYYFHPQESCPTKAPSCWVNQLFKSDAQ